MTDDIITEELSREQILDLVDGEGKKFGFLLATSPLDEKTKEAILSVVGQATPEQLEAIITFFEEGYLKAQNADLDTWLKNQLTRIKVRFDKEQGKVDAETLKKMDELEKKI